MVEPGFTRAERLTGLAPQRKKMQRTPRAACEDDGDGRRAAAAPALTQAHACGAFRARSLSASPAWCSRAGARPRIATRVLRKRSDMWQSRCIAVKVYNSIPKLRIILRNSKSYSELWIGSFCSCTISTVQLPKCCPTSQVGVHLEDPSEIFLLQSRKLHVTGCRHAAHAPLWAIWSASIACHFNLRNPRNDVAGYVNPEWGNWLFAITPASRWRRTPSPSLPYSIPLFGMQEFFPWQAEIWCSKLQYVNPEWGNWLFSGFSCSNHENVKKKRTMEFSTPRFQNHTQMCTQSLQNKHAFPFFFGMCRRTLTKLTQ
jgi:hypothetical protein